MFATLPEAGRRGVEGGRFVSANGTQQEATLAFDAAEWSLDCFNNSGVNTEPFRIQYHATTR